MHSPIESRAPKADSYTTPLSQYVTGDYTLGKNGCGWAPVADCVLVLPDKPIRMTAGNILIPESVADKKADGAESGIIVALGPDAFIWDSDKLRRLEGKEKPQVGHRAVFNRYSGIKIAGDDGQTYYILTDGSVKATRPL